MMVEGLISSLEQNAVFDTLSSDQLKELSQLVETIHLEPEDILFEKGEAGNHLYTINEGLLKISVEDEATGREKTLALLGENEIVGEMAVFGDQSRSGKAIALRETELLQIPETNVLEMLADHPQIGLNLIKILSERLMMTDEEIQTVTFQTVPGRLAAQLLRLSETFGEKTPDGIEIQINLTHEQLADLVGTNRETVTRYIGQFKSEGSVEVNDHLITVVDPAQLEQWM